MKLQVDKYSFADSVEREDVNYFNATDRTFVSTLDLYDYMIQGGLSEIEFSSNRVQEGKLYREAGDVSIQCSNTLYGWGSLGEYVELTETPLIEYFGLYSAETKTIFKLSIFEDERADPIWIGFIRRELITIPNRADEVLTIRAIAIDKEFSEYYSNQTLIGFDNFPVHSLTTTFGLIGLKFALLKDAIRLNFSGLGLVYNSDIETNHFICNIPYVYSPVTFLEGTQTLLLKSGYDQFVLDGIDMLTWLDSICIPRGWVYYFVGENLKITKRVSEDTTAETLDYSTDFISHGKEFLTSDYIENVVIENGEFYGANDAQTGSSGTAMRVLTGEEDETWQYIGGHVPVVYSDKEQNLLNYARPFRELSFVTIVGGYQYIRQFNFWNIRLDALEDIPDKKATRYIFGIDSGFTYQFSRKNYSDTHTLILQPYIVSGEYAASIDVANARNSDPDEYNGNGNSYQGAHFAGDNGIYFRGSAADSVVQLNPATVRIRNFEHYANSEEFKAQMKTLTGGGNKVRLNVVVDSIITDIETPYRIANYPYEDMSSFTFYIEKLEVDLLNETTKLILIGQ